MSEFVVLLYDFKPFANNSVKALISISHKIRTESYAKCSDSKFTLSHLFNRTISFPLQSKHEYYYHDDHYIESVLRNNPNNITSIILQIKNIDPKGIKLIVLSFIKLPNITSIKL
jgi:hypothetical protein